MFVPLSVEAEMGGAVCSVSTMEEWGWTAMLPFADGKVAVLMNLMELDAVKPVSSLSGLLVAA